MATVFRGPLISNPRRADPQNIAGRSQDGVKNNLLLTTLRGQDQLPVRQQAWPLPLLVKTPISARTWLQNLLQSTLTPAPAVPSPYLNFDWPLPKPYPTPISARTFIDSMIRLTGQDKLPNRQMDWPLPLLVKTPVSSRTWLQNLQQTTLVPPPVFPQPYLNFDWPLPKPYPTPVSARTFIHVGVKMIGQDKLPFRQLSWPLPLLVKTPVSARFWSQSLQQTTLPPPPPPPTSLIYVMWWSL